MAKVGFDIAVAFAPQSAEGVYDTTLGAVTTSLSGDPDGVDEGLLLGDPGSGIAESGLDFTVGRASVDKAPFSGSFSRPLSDFLKAEVRSFSYSFPFVGNRGLTTGAPIDADFQPLRGVEALLNGAGLVGAAWGAGVGWTFSFGSPFPFSALVYYFGNRLELLDCRCASLGIAYTPGGLAIATAEIVVGSIADPAGKGFAPAAIPSTLAYGAQATVSSPTVETVGHTWQDLKGFQSLELTITPAIDDIPDSNQVGGEVKEPSGREVTIEATLFADSVDAVYELDQALATVAGDLDPLTFQVGTAAIGSDPALSHSVSIPLPELDESSPDRLGSKAGNTVSLIARGSAADNELEIIFQ